MKHYHFSNFGRAPVPYDLCRLGPRAYLVLEKMIFKGFLPYMGMGAILVNGL